MTYKNTLLVLAWFMFAGTGGALTILAGAHLYLSPSLPSVETLRDIRLQTPLRIYSIDDKLIGEIGEMRRTPVKYQEIPQGYIDAILSAEDAQFYSHHGVSLKGLMRASSQLLMSGDIQGGGSTITMQVARNFFLSTRQEFKRKFNEILLALRIERELTKQEILELYVNVIFLGNRAYGIQAAAQVYYGKPLDQLSIAQLATLAAIPKAPSTMNPLANPQRALERRNWILGRMLSLQKIDQTQYAAALAEPIGARYHGSNLDLSASYVAEMARRRAIELFGPAAYTDGYRIYTTIHSDLQLYARRAAIVGLQDYDLRHGFRGAEQQIPLPDSLQDHLTQEPDAEENPPSLQEWLAELDQNALADWQQTLSTALGDVPMYADMMPAAVVAVLGQSALVILRNGERVTLGWDQGLSDWRPYVTVDRRGPRPRRARDLLQPGDVVRVVRDDAAGWRLTQLPDAQAALVVLNPQNGAVQALIGGLDFQQSNFNRAIQARRQPGSSFKPFIFATALEQGFTAASVINDAPLVFEDSLLEGAWRPENAGGRFYGPTRLRQALYMSRNLVAIRLLRSLGIQTVINNSARFGMDPASLPRDLSLALGSNVMTPLEVAAGYAVFANGGFKVEPHFIDRILNFDGEIVYQANPLVACRGCDESVEDPTGYTPRHNDPFLFAGDPFAISQSLQLLLGNPRAGGIRVAPQVLDDQTAYIMDSMLKDVVQRGTATRAKAIGRSDLAGKTGTTNDATDVWFAGYGGDLVTIAWLGFDNLSTLGRQEFGGTAALPMWINFMQAALRNRPEIQLPRPPGLVTLRINPETGRRARPDDPNAIFEIFRQGQVPQDDAGDAPIESPWQRNLSTEELF